METIQPVFNSVQLHILNMFNYCHSDESIQELQSVLADYYAAKVQEEADRLWDEGTLSGEAIETMLSEHLRTPYNTEK